MFNFFSCCIDPQKDVVRDDNRQEELNPLNNKEDDYIKQLIKERELKYKSSSKVSHYRSSSNTRDISKFENKSFIEDLSILKQLNPQTVLVADNFKFREELHTNYSVEGLLSFIKSLKELEWKPLYSKDNLVLHYREEGSPLTGELYLGKCQYTIPKSDLKKPVSIKRVRKLMYDPEVRSQWDKSIKSYRVKELNKETTFQVYHMHCHSPAFFISERDLVDKRVEFFEGEAYYNFANSIENSEYLPEIKDVVRIKNYINIMSIKIDDKGIHYFGINQIDLKMALPQFFYNMFLPFKVKGWYDEILKIFNSDLYSDY